MYCCRYPSNACACLLEFGKDPQESDDEHGITGCHMLELVPVFSMGIFQEMKGRRFTIYAYGTSFHIKNGFYKVRRHY